ISEVEFSISRPGSGQSDRRLWVRISQPTKSFGFTKATFGRTTIGIGCDRRQCPARSRGSVAGNELRRTAQKKPAPPSVGLYAYNHVGNDEPIARWTAAGRQHLFRDICKRSPAAGAVYRNGRGAAAGCVVATTRAPARCSRACPRPHLERTYRVRL